MVVVTFPMDSVLYPDLTNDDVVSGALTNFRNLVRMHKGHPAVLMWAISNEPNDPTSGASYADSLGSFFQVYAGQRL